VSEKQSEEVAARPAAEAPPERILVRRPLWLVLTLFGGLCAVGWLAKIVANEADPELARAWLLSDKGNTCSPAYRRLAKSVGRWCGRRSPGGG
jgi:hypothetical protein